MYNGKVKCLSNDLQHSGLTVGKIYEFKDGRIAYDNGNLSGTYSSLEDFTEHNNSIRFEEVKGKIVLLLPKNGKKYVVVENNIEYKLYNYNGDFELDIFNNNTTSYSSIGLKTKDDFIFYKPLLDALNIEIIEEKSKYKIDSDIEYTEQEIEKFKELGLKFKKVD